VVAAVQCALNQITDDLACAEPHWEMGASIAVISGKDTRYGNKDYVTQLHSGISGGPGMNGHDGYLFYAISTGGMHIDNSKEMIERAYPVLYIRQDIMTDGLGAGKWDGAPTIRTIVRTTTDPVTIVWVSDGHYHPARGAAGGQDGLPARTFLVKVTNGTDAERLEELPTVYKITLQPGQGFDHLYSSSGGYGDPLERDPEMVRHRAREGWISLETALEVYGVVLDTEPERFAVDMKATEELRKILRSKKK
jgi:N-methylhydantoinase B